MEMKSLVIASRVLSTLFRPSYYPTVCFAIVLTFTLLASTSRMSWPLRTQYFGYGLLIVAIVMFFTILLPYAGVYTYRRLAQLSKIQLRQQRYRYVPYLINILCYGFCLQFLLRGGLPSNLCCIIVASLVLQICCTVINFWHKVSMHSAAAAGLVGTLMAYSFIYNFNPLWWLCMALLLWGCVASSRLILRIHNLPQVLIGSLVGLVSTMLSILHASTWIG